MKNNAQRVFKVIDRSARAWVRQAVRGTFKSSLNDPKTSTERELVRENGRVTRARCTTGEPDVDCGIGTERDWLEVGATRAAFLARGRAKITRRSVRRGCACENFSLSCVNLRCASPAPKPAGFGPRLRLRAKRTTVQGSPLMGSRRRGLVKSGVAMVILEV